MLAFLLGTALVVTAAYVILKMMSVVDFLQRELEKPIPVVLEDPTSTDPVTVPSIFSPPTKSLSIIVPAYNEEARLGATLDETISYLEKRRNRQGPHFTYEIVVVDDGSKDRTVRVAFDYVNKYGFDNVRLLRVPQNRGKGHAVRRGMMVARGEYCLMMDADGATRVSDLEKLEEALARCMVKGAASSSAADELQGQLGVAVGSRAHLEKAAMSQRSPLRNFLTRGFHFLVTFVAGGRIKDTQCGYKLFTRRAAAELYSNQRLQRWCFDVELIYLADQLGIPVTEVFVNWTEMPGSKIRPTSVLHMAFELLMLKVSYQILGVWRVLSEAEVKLKAS